MAKTRDSKAEEEEEQGKDDMDYAGAADSFAAKQADPEDSSSSSSDEQSIESEGHEGRQPEEQEGSEEIDNNGDDSSEEDEEDPASEQFEQPTSSTGEPCTFDLRNLLAVNAHQINTKMLYSTAKGENESVTIPSIQILENIMVDEEQLIEKATDGCTQLIAGLWQLPTERSSVGTMVHLPSFDDTRIPRALPPPEPKAETKWEKFARERGIPLNKEKRSQKVLDEATGTWMFRHGYRKANDEGKEWPIMEVKEGEDPFADPWEKQRDAKRSRSEKNAEQRMRNQERAGKLDKGTTTRVMKSRDKNRKLGKEGGNVDRDSVPVGVPVDVFNRKTGNAKQPAMRGKPSTIAALEATQRSTASLGKFDKMREGEPERKKVNSKAKKRKYETATDRKVLTGETERSLKVLKTVVDGGGVTRERDSRKGKLAKGETAYDYDFDDGLGPSSYKKKKGRAGVGKQKKMTKKRMK